ncbi:MAG: flagellar M-ring protein FliF C-terminal domain-containing protein [Paracoccaceae bacterium]
MAGLILDGDESLVQDAGGAERSADLRRNVERLLAARVGPGKAVVEVSVDVVTERESITERTFDPKGRVAISTDTQETTNSATEPSSDVTVASNLPSGDAAAGGNGQSQASTTSERVNFEVSETNRELLRSPGSIRKLSVAVLVDGLQITAADGTISWQPRPEEELAVLRELVASAVGLDETRGDVLTLKSLAFEPIPESGTLIEAGMLSGLGPINLMSIIQIAVLAVVSLILGLFVIRPILTNATRRLPELISGPVPLALPGVSSELGDGRSNGTSGRVLTGEIDDGFALPTMDFATDDGDMAYEAQDPMSRLRRLIEERQTESVEILRGWMEAEEEKT